MYLEAPPLDSPLRFCPQAIKRITPFYQDKMDKKLDAFELNQLINRIKAWPSLERVLGMDDETEVAIV